MDENTDFYVVEKKYDADTDSERVHLRLNREAFRLSAKGIQAAGEYLDAIQDALPRPERMRAAAMTMLAAAQLIQNLVKGDVLRWDPDLKLPDDPTKHAQP